MGIKTREELLRALNGNTTADVLVENQGTIWVFRPLSDEAQEWIDEHVQSEPWQWFGGGLVVDHRYGPPLAEGMQEAGLVLE